MDEKLNTRAIAYFQDDPATKYQKVLAEGNARKLDEFYLLLVLRKLGERDELLDFLQSLKVQPPQLQKQGILRVEHLLECLWSLALYAQGQPNVLKQLHEFVMELASRSIVERSLLMQKLSDSTNFACGFLQQESYLKKHGRVMTRMRFEQNKFNLFRESNEGYSKVALLLLSLRNNDQADKINEQLTCLIGYFDLDPDRVIDLILDAFVQNSTVALYTQLLKKFQRSSVPPLICQRLVKAAADFPSDKLVSYDSVDYFLAESIQNLPGQEAWTPNLKLLRVVAVLIKGGLLKLEEVSNSLSPTEAFFQSDALRRKEMAKLKFNEAFVFNSEELTDKQKRDMEKAERTDFYGQLLFSTRLWLMSQLAEINDWQHFYAMWFMYGQNIDLISHQPTLRNLFRLLDWSIDAVYQKISYSRLFTKKRQPPKQDKQPHFDPNIHTRQIQQAVALNEQFFDQVEDILSVVKGYIGFCPPTYIKLCRIFRKLIGSPEVFGVASEQLVEFRERIRQLIKLYLLPGIAAQKCNPSLEVELFQLLTLEDFQFRYNCYLQNLSTLTLANPYFVSLFSRKKKEQNVLFNTLSAQKKKQYFKALAKLTSNHPFCVFYWVTKRIMSEAQTQSIPEIVNVLMNCSKLAMDVFVFVVLFAMLENKESSWNSKTGDVAAWYRNCYMFFGLFYRKHPETDIAPLVIYILGKLGRPIKELFELGELQSLELKILKEVILKMSGVSVQEEVNRSQLAAGPKMLAELQSSDSRPTKKSKSELENYFYERTINYAHERSLAFHLLVLIAQKRAETVLYSDLFDVKLLAEVYDEYTTSFIQLVRMLNLLAADHVQFGKLLPENSLREMILNYKIPIELAFQIFRSSLKNTSSMTADEWARTLKEVSAVLEEVLFSDSVELTLSSYRPNPNLQSNLQLYKRKFKKCLTYQLYSSFWLLNLDCVFYPNELYSDKLDELKKKINGWRNTDRTDKELEKTKTLMEKLSKESEAQRRKQQETMEEANKHKILIDRLNDRKTDKTDEFLETFAEMLSQMCILPRLLLEPKEALYCAKFVLMFVRANQLNSNRSVKLINFLLENIISYLAFSTHRESVCITIFTSELLGVFANWNDPDKLKNDFLTKLGTDEHLIKDNFSKMKDYLLNKMFDRIALYIKAVREEPYLIKNALYLLDKLEIIPAFKQQAEELENYLKDLKERFYDLKDMKPIIDRIMGILARKKTSLPQRPIVDDKKKPVAVAPPPHGTAAQEKSPALANGSSNGNSGTPLVAGGGQPPQQSPPSLAQSANQSSVAPVPQQRAKQPTVVSDNRQRQESTVKGNTYTRNPPKDSREPAKELVHKESNRQSERALKFSSNPIPPPPAALNPSLSRDLEKGEISSTPAPTTPIPDELAQMPMNVPPPRTLKQVKQERLKNIISNKNAGSSGFSSQPIPPPPPPPRLQSNVSGLQQDQTSDGEILATRDDRRERDKDRELKEIKKEHAKDVQREPSREATKEPPRESPRENMRESNPRDQKNQREQIRNRIKEKSQNPPSTQAKEETNTEPAATIKTQPAQSETTKDTLVYNPQTSSQSQSSTVIPPKESGSAQTSRRQDREPQQQKDRRSDKDDRDRKDYDKDDRRDKKYYDHRDSRRRSSSKGRSNRR